MSINTYDNVSPRGAELAYERAASRLPAVTAERLYLAAVGATRTAGPRRLAAQLHEPRARRDLLSALRPSLLDFARVAVVAIERYQATRGSTW